MLWHSPFFYMEAKFGPSGKKDKKRLTSIEMKFFRTAVYTHFDHKRGEEILEELKVEPVDGKLRRYSISRKSQITIVALLM